MSENNVSGLFDERLDVVLVVSAGPIGTAPMVDVLFDVVKALHRHAHDPETDGGGLCIAP